MPANGSKKLVNQHALTVSTANVPFYRISHMLVNTASIYVYCALRDITHTYTFMFKRHNIHVFFHERGESIKNIYFLPSLFFPQLLKMFYLNIKLNLIHVFDLCILIDEQSIKRIAQRSSREETSYPSRTISATERQLVSASSNVIVRYRASSGGQLFTVTRTFAGPLEDYAERAKSRERRRRDEAQRR